MTDQGGPGVAITPVSSRSSRMAAWATVSPPIPPRPPRIAPPEPASGGVLATLHQKHLIAAQNHGDGPPQARDHSAAARLGGFSMSLR